MRTLFYLTVLCTVNAAHAILPGGSEYSGGFERINHGTFQSRFMLRGEMFVLDKTGTKLLSPTSEVREWQPGKTGKIDTHWSVKAKGIQDMHVRIQWQIKPDNSIDVKTSQYKGEDKPENLLKEEAKTLENFAPLSWVAETGKDYRVVLRFTPIIEPSLDGEASDKMRIGGDRGSFEVTDNQGYLWSDNVRFGGVLAGLTSHRGSFIVSFYPFKGAKEMGYALGRVIRVNLTEDLKVKINSETDLVPGERKIKVYGRYYPNVKSEGPQSAVSYGQMRLDGFPKELQ